MRITIAVPHLDLSGGLRIALMYADGLASRGHLVTLVYGPHEPNRKGWFASFLGKARYATFLPSSEVRLIYSKHRDSALVGDLPDADVLIGTWWETIEAVSEAPPEKGIKIHLVQDHEVFPYLPAGRTSAVYRLPICKICVSRWLFETMQFQYGARNLALISNPVDVTAFPYSPRSWSSSPTVGFLYSAAPRKNSLMAFDVVRLARKEIPDLKLKCFGVQKPPKEFRSEYEEFWCSPHQDLIPSIYRSCDFWLFTSLSEGFGLPILEAFAVGTPVIATPAGAAPDLVSDETGALVGYDPEEMANALVRLINSKPETWQQMSRTCRMVAEANDVKCAVDKFEAVLANLTQEAGSNPST